MQVVVVAVVPIQTLVELQALVVVQVEVIQLEQMALLTEAVVVAVLLDLLAH